MNSIVSKQNQVWQRFQILPKTRFFVRKNFSKDSPDDSSQEEKPVVRKGILHDKQQSVKEESYFHKEEREQLKMLKQKLKKLKGKKTEQSDKDENK